MIADYQVWKAIIFYENINDDLSKVWNIDYDLNWLIIDYFCKFTNDY